MDEGRVAGRRSGSLWTSAYSYELHLVHLGGGLDVPAYYPAVDLGTGPGSVLGGGNSVTTCRSSIKLVALPEEGVVISVQANTAGAETNDAYLEVILMTHALRDAVEG